MIDGDRNALRDRTLILRIQDEALCKKLKKKISDIEEPAAKLQQQQQASSQYRYHNQPTQTAPSESKLFDLEGVSCQPASQSILRPASSNPLNSSSPANEDDATLWDFKCDGKSYPARLSNLPCPVELHKTRDRKLYHKSVDVAQILIVYSDRRAMEAMERLYPRLEGFPSYHPSGLTPPMGKCVENRFAKREHSAVPPPRQEIMEVEKELMELVKRVNKDGGKKTGGGGSKGGGASQGSKELREIEDEVVQYEPWMDNYGTETGVEFSEDDELCLQHPELWLDPKEMGTDEKNSEEEKVAPIEGDSEVTKTKKKSSNNGSPNKKKKPKKKKDKSPKVAVNRPRNEENVLDDVEKIAQDMSQNKVDDVDLFFSAENDLFDFDDGDLEFM